MSKKKTSKSELDGIELHPDAWQRFERFVDTKVRTSAPPPAKRTPTPQKSVTKKRLKKP